MVREFIKATIQSCEDRKYDKTLSNKSISFDSWIREKEKDLDRFDMSFDVAGNDFDRKSFSWISFAAKYEDTTVRIIPYTNVDSHFKISNYIEDILIFVNGELTDKAIPLLAKKFNSNPDMDICYGDEDIADYDATESNRYGRSVEGTRRIPYFKPEWSPNAFLDHFYFCNVVAIRRASFRNVSWDNEFSGAPAIYNVLLRYIFSGERNVRRSVDSIQEILVHAENYELNYIKDRNAYTYVSDALIDKEQDGKISVVIPSKDNPELLKQCITSLYADVEYAGKVITAGITEISIAEPEIIVVDNGSALNNRKQIEALSQELGFKYIYEPGEFNFAAMINRGVEESTGKMVILLNDDITFTNPGTLFAMYKQAILSFSGAVGIKLRYPDSTMIQHAGVINNRIGPVHKLQFQNDEEDHYYGFNASVQNVSAVTAACLMVRRSVFDKVRGMNESLKVAFNDVDFCFKLMEAGYVNTVVNTTFAEHAESVTRGKDTDVKSIKRLNAERDRLYTLHPALKNYDPYYSHKLLADCLDVRIIGANLYEYEKALEVPKTIKNISSLEGREDECVRLSVEYSGEMKGFSFDEKDMDFYLIQGFSYVSGSDNACYAKELILKEEASKKIYVVRFDGSLRTDVYEACRDEKNVALSGFCLKIPKGLLPKGEYRVGMRFSKFLSKEKLYIFSNKFLDSLGE